MRLFEGSPSTFGAAVDLLQGDATELALDADKVYSIRVTYLASNEVFSGAVEEVHRILARATTVGGVPTLVIDDDSVVTSASGGNALGILPLSISAPGGLVLRLTAQSTTYDATFMARVEWTALFGV